MFKLRRFLSDYKKECIIGPLCKLFEAILELFVPLVMANIIDVGINVGEDGKLCGDVDFASVEPLVAALSPVPGGLGGVTSAVLAEHVVRAAVEQNK